MDSLPIAAGLRPTLFGDCPVEAAVDRMALAGKQHRGAIFTRGEVVDFILDLVGYTSDKDLFRQTILEPSFGGGDFLFAIVRRLLTSYRRVGGSNYCADLRNAINGVELHAETFSETAAALQASLEAAGLAAADARALCGNWLRPGDFLLAELPHQFDYVVGNPPYVRSELIPDALIAEYRRRYATIYDRADIYIPFIERSLASLSSGGIVGFICADRWMKNKYGKHLRKLVADRYRLCAYVDMVDTPAFHSEVMAYPGIFMFANEEGGVTRVAHRPDLDATKLKHLARALRGETTDSLVSESRVVSESGEPWIVEGGEQVDLVRALERRLPTLEEAGCQVGIGVATGADKAFIGPLEELDVEPDRKLPLIMTRDIQSGAIAWRGLGVINPFAEHGGLVNLKHYPRLEKFLEDRRDQIAGRHVAQKSPKTWYRTIDRIYPALVGKPKLLIPDIKGDAHIVYDAGQFYPHHNLYFITSETWDLRALQAVLLSGIARLFVETYSTKMRGGYLRFQAQYLRRIRLPHWADVPGELRERLITAASHGDLGACNASVAELYQLTPLERAAVGGALEIA